MNPIQEAIEIENQESLENVERNIQQQLAEITTLVNTLTLTSHEQINTTISHKDDNENDEIIYGWESDQEIYMQDDKKDIIMRDKQPESSQAGEERGRELLKLKSKLAGLRPDKEKHLNARGYYRKDNNKIRKYPIEYKPKYVTLGGDGILNLDCVKNPEELINEWQSKIELLLQIEKPFGENPNNKDYIWNFVTYKTSGIVHNFLTENEIGLKSTPHYQATTRDVDTFEIIAEEIYKEFIGRDILLFRHENKLAKRKSALNHLNNMRICDICYFEQFVCEFRKYYYELTRLEQEQYTQIFIQKLPYPMNVKVADVFQERIEQHSIAHNLGGAILITKEILAQQCLESQLRKTLKHQTIQLCCEDNAEVPQQYGCKQFTKKYHKSYKRFKRYKKPYKNYRWNRYPSKYFRKRSFKPFKKDNRNYFRKRKYRQFKPKQKYCPTNKKDCRCWICNEIGHYANKCPKKTDKSFTNNIHILNSAFQNHLEPIESEYETSSTISSLYFYETDHDSQQSSESESTIQSQRNFYTSSDSSN